MNAGYFVLGVIAEAMRRPHFVTFQGDKGAPKGPRSIDEEAEFTVS
jgi:hypothetical protein